MDENLEQIDRIMEEAAENGSRVHIIFKDGDELEGIATGYSQYADEEDEIPKIDIDTDDGEYWCAGADEIQTIDVIG